MSYVHDLHSVFHWLHVLSYYSHCSNLCCWSFGEAMNLWLWIKCGKPVFCLFSYGMYLYVCVSYCFCWVKSARVDKKGRYLCGTHWWFEKRVQIIASPLMVWSQLSQCHLFLVCLLKMTLILGMIWTCLFRGSFTAGFIWELEVYFQEMEGFLWRELGVYVLKFWKVLCIFWSFV